MQMYFVRCTRPDGSTVVERVNAPSATAALAGCRARGYTDTQLVADEILSGSKQADLETELSAEDEVGIMLGGRWTAAWIAFRSGWFIWVPALGLVLYRVLVHGTLGLLGIAALAAVGFCVHLAMRSALASQPYNQLLRAIARGHWERALRLLEPLESSPQMAEANASSELGFRRAQILIGLGRHAEARAAAEAAAADPSQPDWFLLLRMADFHLGLQDGAAAEACYRKAIELAAQNAVVHLAYAEFQAGHTRRDPRGARGSLETARYHTVAPTLRWAELKIEGMIEFEEGSYPSALDKLERARVELRRLPDTGTTPVADAYIGAYSCLALAAMGQRDQAAERYRRIEPWLAPHPLGDLTARCRTAIGLAPRTVPAL